MTPGRAIYDPFAAAVLDDPYPVYARLRAAAPVYRSEEHDFWALSRHGDVKAALADAGLFSSRNGVSLFHAWGPDAARTASFIAMDAPGHTRLRKLTAPPFSRRQIAAMEPRIREMARLRLAALRDMPALVDVAASYAALLPMDVICEMTAVPAADREQVRAAAVQMTQAEQPRGGAFRREAITWLAAYYAALTADLRRAPRDDLTSALILAGLPDSEIIPALFLLIAAGHETTGLTIGNAIYQGWVHPHVQQAGLSGRAGDWVSETLRFDGANQLIARVLTRPGVLHGISIPEGARILLLPASANRDSSAFPDPDRFDLDRRPSQASGLIAFGQGPHYCLGAGLAHMQARIALEELGRVAAGYEIDPGGLKRTRSSQFRGFTALPCSLARA